MNGNVLLITNINTHYRDPLFRILRKDHGFDFAFYSDGGEPYWTGDVLPVTHLGTAYPGGFWIGRTRIVPRLIAELFRSSHPTVVCTAGGKFVLPVVWLFTRARRRRLVLWTGTWRRPTFGFHRRARPLIDWLMRDADAIVAYGDHIKRFLVSSGVNPSRIHVAAQAVNNERFLAPIQPSVRTAHRRALGLGAGDVLILYVGRLAKSKGVDTLIRAFAAISNSLPDTYLAIAGTGVDERHLRRLVAQFGVHERVMFIGRVANADLPVVYQSSEIVVVPSEPTIEGAEPWGLVVNEAMASGCAVVVSNSVGSAAHGLPKDGVSGYVFPAGDAATLANVLRKLATDETMRTSCGERARVHVRQFTFDSMVATIVKAVERPHLQPTPYLA